MNRRPGLLASVALCAIRGYQRYLSPHKGFSCAYRCATGRDGCSGYGYRVIARFGLIPGLALLRRRLRLCGETHRNRPVVRNPVLHYQHGDCDIPCDADCLPDMPRGSTIGRCVGDFFTNCYSCDGSMSSDEKKRKDKQQT